MGKKTEINEMSSNSDEISHTFYSHLISDYEQAISRGLQPQRALSLVLGWAAEEAARLQESGAGPDDASGEREKDVQAGDVFVLAYHSKNRLPGLDFSPQGELAKIMDAARKRNKEAGVTGVLLLNTEHFVQILEGDEDAVRTIFESIKRDPRHTAVTVIASGRKPKRDFEGWSMALVGASKESRAFCWYLGRQRGFSWE